jgi:hypothetical protein
VAVGNNVECAKRADGLEGRRVFRRLNEPEWRRIVLDGVIFVVAR